MKKTTYVCDRCGAEIDDVVFAITCYAEDLNPGPYGGVAGDVIRQNCRQNSSLSAIGERHLCRQCKDEITDGVFIV